MPSKILSIADALNNPLRRRILLLLTERPGMSLRQLARELEVGTGNLAGHLLILERVGLIKEEREGNRLRFYVNEKLILTSRNDGVSAKTSGDQIARHQELPDNW